MTQFYFDPSRADDPHALTDAEAFYVDLASAENDMRHLVEERGCEPRDVVGWYWWACFPGYLPDSEPAGPFASEADAIADARDIYRQAGI